jgi:AraC-like DNA-binding protein
VELSQTSFVKNGHFLKVTKTSPKHLKEYIKFFYTVHDDGYNEMDAIHRRLPDGTLDLVFNLGATVSISGDGSNFLKMPSIAITGLHPNRRFVKYGGSVNITGAVFQPGAAHLFINDTLEPFQSCDFDASVVYGNDIYFLLEQLYEASSEREKHGLLEQFLLIHLKNKKLIQGGTKTLSIVQSIYSADGNIGMKDLHNDHCMSERNFRRKFLEEVGMSPKQFSTIIRVKSFSRYFESERTGYSDLIHKLGYTDHSHFNKEFQKIVGVNPTTYFGQLNRIGSEFIHLI